MEVDELPLGLRESPDLIGDLNAAYRANLDRRDARSALACFRAKVMIERLQAKQVGPMPDHMDYPKVPGFYWAQWKIAADGTHEGEHLAPSNSWDVVELWENGGDPEEGEDFGVSVSGVRETQWPECFYWGPGPLVVPA